MPYRLTKDGETTIKQTEDELNRFLRHGWKLVEDEKPSGKAAPPPAAEKPEKAKPFPKRDDSKGEDEEE